MSFCKNCGRELKSDMSFCPVCGTPCSAGPAEPQIRYYGPVPEIIIPGQEKNDLASAKASGKLDIFQLVWSIINLILCCMPFGIAALVMTVVAKDARSAAEEAQKLKTARTCNIIGTAAMLLSVFGYAMFYILFFLGLL